jgi:hypothetical protein
MNISRRSSAVVLAVLAIATGCTKLPKNTSLMAATQAPDHVVLDVFFVRVPLSDQAVIRDLWPEVDEQAVPLDVRRRLVANGFVVGQLGSQLPAALADLLKIRDDAPTLNPTQPPAVDLTKPTLVHRKRLDIYRPETPSRIVVTGQDERHEKLTVMFCDEDGDHPFVWGKDFYNVQGILSTNVQPEPDGRVKLTLVPEVEHDQARQQFTAQAGAGFEVQFAPPHKTFDSLRFSSTLSAGEMLIVSCQGDRPGSLGQQFFTERQADVLNQIVLIIRVAQGKADNLFTAQTRAD